MTDDAVSMKEYVDLKCQNLKDSQEWQFKYNQLQATLSQLAIDKAEQSMQHRMENTNEWRAQSKDREAAYATKDSVVQIGEANDKRINTLERASSFSAGKMYIIMGLFTVIPTLIALGSWLFSLFAK